LRIRDLKLHSGRAERHADTGELRG
jgi:hypothetical protein